MPAWFRPVINWASHLITRGLTAIGLLPQAKERYPGIPETTLEQVIGLGQQAVQNAAEANRLPTTSPLRDALGGRPPLENVAEVRVLIDLMDAAGLTDNMSIRVTVPWDTSIGEILDILEIAIIEKLGNSPGLAITDVNFIPPLLLGPGTGAIPEQAVTGA